MVCDVLESRGAVAVGAADGAEALERYQSYAFDLVWLDLRMSGLDGMRVLKRIHTINPLAHVVIMTAYGDCDTYIDAISSGAVAMVKKPFTAQQIISVSEHALRANMA